MCRSLTREIFKAKPEAAVNINTGQVINGLADGGLVEEAIEKYKATIGKYITIVEGNFTVTAETIRKTAKDHIQLTERKPVISPSPAHGRPQNDG